MIDEFRVICFIFKMEYSRGPVFKINISNRQLKVSRQEKPQNGGRAGEQPALFKTRKNAIFFCSYIDSLNKKLKSDLLEFGT